MKLFLVRTGLVAVLSMPVAAQDVNLTPWKFSVATLAAAHAADIASSMLLNRRPDLRESNGLLATSTGQYATGRAIALNAGVTAALLVPELLLVRHHPKLARTFTYMNFGAAVIPAAAAVHNLRQQ